MIERIGDVIELSTLTEFSQRFWRKLQTEWSRRKHLASPDGQTVLIQVP